MNLSKHFGVSVLALALAAFGSSLVQAQTAQNPAPRPLPAPADPNDPYAPLGVPVGGFILFPNVKVGETFDDNIFRDTTNEESDFITTVSPELQLKSNWNNHALNFRAASELGFYASNSDENYTDFTVGTDGRLDIMRSTNVTAGLTHTEGHEERGSPDDVNGVEPTDTHITQGRLGAAHSFNRLTIKPMASWARYNYDDAITSAGATINNDDRDNDQIKGILRAEYDIHPDFDVFAEGSYNTISYSSNTDDSGFDRDSQGYEGRVGGILGLTNLITGEAYVGYLSQSVDDSRLSDISGVSYGAGLRWEVTRLTSLGFNAERTIQQTTVVNSSGILQSAVEATVEHELLRNLILDAGVKYTLNEYESITREDNLYEGRIGALYKLNRYAGLGASYRYVERDSDVPASDFTANIATLQLVLQY